MSEEIARPSMQQAAEQAAAAPKGPCDDPEIAACCRLVRRRVSRERFRHIVRVARTAVAIGAANGFSRHELSEVALAALLHDAARDMSAAELLRLAPPANELEAAHPLVLHGRVARRLAEEWGVTDPVVLEAVEGHVFGVPAGHKVGMSVYVADVCEPGRGVNDDLRELAMHDLAAAYRRAVVAKVDYLRSAGKPVHPDTLSTYASLVGEAHDA